MKVRSVFFVAAASFLIVNSCSKPGTGGKATLVIFPQHHGKTIPNRRGYPYTVFLKFNVKELPGLHAGDYDTYFIGTPG